MCYSDSLANRLLGYLAIPFAHNLMPRKPVFDLFKNHPDHDAGTFERGLAAAHFWIRDDMPPKFNPMALAVGFGFHAAALQYALNRLPGQVG